MKRFLMLVLMLCLCVGLCAGCAQNQQPDPQKPENGKLTAEELEEFQAMFTPGSWYSQATTSSYTSPKDIDLHHLFYDGIGFSGLLYGHTYLTDRERAYLTSLDPESVMQYFRAPRQVMDAVLKEYFGVSLAETNQVGLSKFIYWAETDSCYEMTFFNRKSQRTFTCQIVQNTKRHLKRAKTMQISGIGHSVIRGLVTTGQWFSASTTVYPRGSPQGRRHSYFVDC